MPTGAIPQNQLDALPILTVAQVAEGGDLQVIGGNLYRSFSSAALQINTATISTSTQASIVLGQLNTSITAVNNALATLGASSTGSSTS